MAASLATVTGASSVFGRADGTFVPDTPAHGTMEAITVLTVRLLRRNVTEISREYPAALSRKLKAIQTRASPVPSIADRGRKLGSACCSSSVDLARLRGTDCADALGVEPDRRWRRGGRTAWIMLALDRAARYSLVALLPAVALRPGSSPRPRVGPRCGRDASRWSCGTCVR